MLIGFHLGISRTVYTMVSVINRKLGSGGKA